MHRVLRRDWRVWAIVLAILKLWAIAHLPIRASFASHDNLRYVITAANWLQGDVPYDGLVLARQPGYPGLIWLSYHLGIPLRLAQEGLYLLAAGLLAAAFYRWVRRDGVTLLLFWLYAWAPFSVHWNRQTLQEVLYLPLVAVVVAGLLHLLKDVGNLQRFWWDSLGLGLVLAWFWNTRPEGIWIVPAIALTYGIIAWQRLCFGVRGVLRQICYSALLIVAPVVFATTFLAYLNYQQYGLYNTYDLKSPGLTAAYRSLQRVSPQPRRRYVAIPAATREKIYAVSPSFRRLRDSLEIPADEGWRQASCDFGVCDDYAAGVFFWALRDAVEAEGFYQNVMETEAFYEQIAREVNGACDRNLLNCKSPGFTSFIPSLSLEVLQPWLKSSLRLGYQLSVSSLTLKLDSGVEDVALRQQYYAEIARESADFFKLRSQPGNRFKDTLLVAMAGLYRVGFAVVLGLALMGWGLAWRLGNSGRSLPLFLGAILLFCIIVRLVLVAYIDVTSWPVQGGDRYLRPVLPCFWLLLVFGVEYFTQKLSFYRDAK